mgnify:CR=1 FL=1
MTLTDTRSISPLLANDTSQQNAPDGVRPQPSLSGAPISHRIAEHLIAALLVLVALGAVWSCFSQGSPKSLDVKGARVTGDAHYAD